MPLLLRIRTKDGTERLSTEPTSTLAQLKSAIEAQFSVPFGQQALHRLKAYEGIPAPYSSMKRMVCADALRITRLKPYRKYYSVGELCSSKGWKFGALVERLEANRKEGSAAYYEKKKAAAQESSKAAASACASIDSELAAFGY